MGKKLEDSVRGINTDFSSWCDVTCGAFLPQDRGTFIHVPFGCT